MGYTSLGLADRGPLAAFPAFSKAAKQAGIQPIFGMQAGISLTASAGKQAVQPAVLYARSKEGFANLASLAAIGYPRWPKEEQPLSWESVAAHADGLALVLLGANDGGEVAPVISNEEWPGWNARFGELFADATYVGLVPTGEADDALMQTVAAAAKQVGLPLVAMPVARYILAEDATAYKALQIARQSAGWTQFGAGSVPTSARGTEYLRSPEEAAGLFEKWPEALENVAGLVESCFGAGYLDELTTEASEAATQAERARLRDHVQERLQQRLEVESLPDDVQQRLDDELYAYARQNALPAWTALASICEKVRNRKGQPSVSLGAPVGTADGSLLAYALGTSPLNPVGYPRPVWLQGSGGGIKDKVLPAPGVEVPGSRRDALVAELVREYGPDRSVLAACVIEIDLLTALSAASQVLGKTEDIRPLALQAMAEGWRAFEEEQSAESRETTTPARLALSLKGAPLTFKPDPDLLLVAPSESKLPAWLPLLHRDGGNENTWVPWPEEAVVALRLAAVALRPSATLTTLDNIGRLADQYPVPGLNLDELDLSSRYPELGAEAKAAIVKGEVTGIPYLSAAVVKGWKGDTTPAAVAAMVARSLSGRKPPVAPKLDLWAEKTSDTGGMLLYRDQFEAIVAGAAGFTSPQAHSLLSLLLKCNGSEAALELKEQFTQGCNENGINAESTEALWQALAASTPELQSRCSVSAAARTAIWAAFFKEKHPAAFLAAHLATILENGRVSVQALAAEALRLEVNIKPPDASHSQALPILERDGPEWSIIWGLALLPGWSMEVAARFVAARPRGGFGKISDLSESAVEAGLSIEHLHTLVRAGGCDNLGGQSRSRHALLEALPIWHEWGKAAKSRPAANNDGPLDLFSISDSQPPAPPDEKPTLGKTLLTPHERYVQRAWELEQIGVGFTEAAEIESLKRTLESTDLRSRLLSSVEIDERHVGKSVCLVGLLTGIRLVHPHEHGKTGADPMPVAWVEDTEGCIELVAFPPGYKRHAELWTENNAVIVTGRVRKHSDGEIYLLCEHIAAFDAGAEEAELTVKVRQSKKVQAVVEQAATSQEVPAATSNGHAKPSGKGTHSRGTPATTMITRPSPAAHTAPASTNGPSAISVPTMTDTSSTNPEPGDAAGYKIIITLPATEDDRADIDRMIALKEILHEHPGPDLVTLRIPYSPETGHVTSAQLPRGAGYSTLLEADVVRLLGTDAIAVIRL